VRSALLAAFKTRCIVNALIEFNLYSVGFYNMGLMDFFKADWKHSDPRVRKKSIERITDIDVLAEVLQSDEDSTVRQAVLEQLSEIPQRREILAKLTGSAKEHLEKELGKNYFEAALKSKTIADAWLSELGQHQLSRVARESKSEEVQKEALNQLDEKDEISAVITHGDKKIAQLALEKISDREQLTKLEKAAKSKGVKALIRKHYDVLFGEEDRAEEKRQAGLVRLEKTVTLLEGMITLPDWGPLAKSYEAELSKWEENEEYASEELTNRFDEARKKCNKNQEIYQEKEALRLAKEAEITARMDRRRGVLQELNTAVEILQQDEGVVIADCKGKWSAIGEVEDAQEKEIEVKYNKAIETFPMKQLVLKGMAAKKDLIRQNLQEVIDQTTELLKSDNSFDLTKRSKALNHKLSDAVKAAKGDFSELVEEAQNGLAKAQETIVVLEEKEKAQSIELRASYEAILTEISSFENQSKEMTKKVKELQVQWKNLAKLPVKELDALTAKFRKKCDLYFDKVKGAIEEREWNHFANLAAKEKLIIDTEALSAIEDPVELAKGIKDKQTQWKSIGPVPKEKSDEIWEKFKLVSDTLYERCKVYYAAQDVEREKNSKVKEELCEKAESFSESTDWKETAEELKGLQKSWKEVGPAPRKLDKQLWERFRAGCDSFFNRRSEFFAERDSERVENTAKKEALVLEVEQVLNMDNGNAAAAKIKSLQAAWKEVGPAERQKDQELWKRFRAVADEFFNKRRENYEKLQADFDVNAQPKLDLIEALQQKLNGVSDESDWTALAQLFRQSQKDIKTMASAGFDKDKELRQQLKDICDKFFELRNAHYDQLSSTDQDNLNAKEEYCLKVELLAESSEWRETAEELKKLQSEFKDLESINEKYDSLMYKRFNSICQDFFDRRREHFEERDEVRQENLKKKKQLCIQMEKLAGVSYTTESESSSSASVQDMAAQLQNAFDNNFGGYETQSEKPKSFKEASQEVRELQAAWKMIGAVPKAVSQQIWETFRKAADVFYAQRNEFFGHKKQEQAESLVIKKGILVELKSFVDNEADFRQIKILQKKWRECGDVPRENYKEIQSEFKALCDSLYQSSSEATAVAAEGDVRI
jgi:hypothetical protein